MQNWNLYARSDKFFAIAVSVLIGMFTISTLYPFILHDRRHDHEHVVHHSGCLCLVAATAEGA